MISWLKNLFKKKKVKKRKRIKESIDLNYSGYILPPVKNMPTTTITSTLSSGLVGVNPFVGTWTPTETPPTCLNQLNQCPLLSLAFLENLILKGIHNYDMIYYMVFKGYSTCNPDIIIIFEYYSFRKIKSTDFVEEGYQFEPFLRSVTTIQE